MTQASSKSVQKLLQKRVAEMVRAAGEGMDSMLWLDRLITSVGYIRRPKGDGVFATIEQLGRIVRSPNRALRDLIAQGLPCAQQGKGRTPALYDVAAVADWLRRKGESDGWLGFGDSPTLERLRLAEAERKERRNAVEAGRLVPLERVQAEAAALGATLKAELAAVGRSFGPEVDAAIDKAVEQIRSRMHEQFGAGAQVAPVEKSA